MSRFQQAIRSGRMALSAELLPGPGREPERARRLADDFDAVLVNPAVGEPATLPPAAMAALLLREGIDPVCVLNCRDRNRIALYSELLGLRAAGVRCVVLERGEDTGLEKHAKPVYDVDVRELSAIAQELNEDDAAQGQEFLVGARLPLIDPAADWNDQPLVALAAAGTGFLLTRPCLDGKRIRDMMARFVAERLTWRFSVVVTLAVPVSADEARRLADAVPGSRVPASLIEDLETAADPRSEGIGLGARLLRQTAGLPGVSGINLLCLHEVDPLNSAVASAGIQSGS
jgi:5,10-methylenetetrahydrofolate reductase